MDRTNGNSGASSTDRLNYFNYFTEIEEEFVRRRGKPLLISPMDWALVESWKSAGIPLHVVLRAINQAFDSYDSRPRKYRKVNSIFYCQQEVEAVFAEYRLSQVGAPPPQGAEREAPEKASGAGAGKTASEESAASAFPREMILEFLARCDAELAEAEKFAAEANRLPVLDSIARARARLSGLTTEVSSSARVDSEALEHDLDSIDRMVFQSLVAATGEDEIAEIRADAEAQLGSYRNKMDKQIYEQTLNNFVSRRLREANRVPRLSLFYI